VVLVFFETVRNKINESKNNKRLEKGDPSGFPRAFRGLRSTRVGDRRKVTFVSHLKPKQGADKSGFPLKEAFLRVLISKKKVALVEESTQTETDRQPASREPTPARHGTDLLPFESCFLRGEGCERALFFLLFSLSFF
jgi:hypothetical protein